MKAPSLEQIDALISKTWPAESILHTPPVTLRFGVGGQRASAATVDSPITPEQLRAAEDAMKERGEFLFRIRHRQDDLDRLLSDQGYARRDPTNILLGPTSEILSTGRASVTAFAIWPPLGIMKNIWTENDVDEHRQAIMERAPHPKVAILGRGNAKPGGVAFASADTGIAMIHAVAVQKDLRRQKIAQSMMVAIAEWANSNDIPWIATLCTENNTIARRLYQSLGMKIVGQYHYRAKVYERREL